MFQSDGTESLGYDPYNSFQWHVANWLKVLSGERLTAAERREWLALRRGDRMTPNRRQWRLAAMRHT